ncbi:MAG: HlyD family efflux transporter periplasmic adaptor subunit [Alphaproteobacteria bacterium]|nr:HlyD family efflux transporter periplasmic adaptor subunit [Alphaproteobacteria bacterium]MCB9758197.1 HlyD family efflux transporter periplasmic adaptor subunit [Alphaproteobacteria bacterium]MCB9795104.1 HlyD family efflux transporter periplasmic adaptor subunit [Alphaproteobacteria bacterium]
MVPEFSRTTRALAADRGPAGVVVATALLLALAWGAWMWLGEVTLYEASSQARVSAEGVARLRAPVAAEVRAVPVALGDAVEAGAVLLQLDDAEPRLQLAAAQARVVGLEARLEAFDQAREAEAQGREAGDAASGFGLAAAQASLEEARVRATEARSGLSRLASLQAAGAASASEIDAAEAELAAREARVLVLERELGRAAGQRRQQALAGEASVSRETETRSAMEAELAAALAERARAEESLADRTVRAPVAGVVGELASLVPGQRVEAGASVAVVVPDTRPLIEARFTPERAVGRVQPGQSARVRVMGGVGGALGVRSAQVERAGSEPGADGLVAVVLSLDGEAELPHGLVAEVEVEVERLSPVELLVRAAGQASGAR